MKLTSVTYPIYPIIDGTATTYAKDIHAVRGVHRKCLNRFMLLSRETVSSGWIPLGFSISHTGIFDQGRVHVDSYNKSVIVSLSTSDRGGVSVLLACPAILGSVGRILRAVFNAMPPAAVQLQSVGCLQCTMLWFNHEEALRFKCLAKISVVSQVIESDHSMKQNLFYSASCVTETLSYTCYMIKAKL